MFLPTESVTVPSHAPNLKDGFPPRLLFRRERANMQMLQGFARSKHLCPDHINFFISKCLIPVKEISSNHPGCDSDGESSVALYGSEVQDCRERPCQPQIQGDAWI